MTKSAFCGHLIFSFLLGYKLLYGYVWLEGNKISPCKRFQLYRDDRESALKNRSYKNNVDYLVV